MTTGTDPPYGAICEASSDAILLAGTDGRIVYANARVADLFGYDPAELVGEPVEVLVPESDRESHVEHRTGYVDDPETRPMGVGLDLHARRKDGSTFPVDIGLSPLVVDGDRYVMATVRDITERATLRTKYRAILGAVPDAVVVADAGTGEILEVNDRTADLVERDPEDLVGRPQTALHPADESERYRELFDDHVTEGMGIRTHLSDGTDVHVETAGGERVPVEINAHVFERGDRRLAVGVFRDISRRRKRERQLKSLHGATRELVAADSRERIAERVAEAANSVLGHQRTVVRLTDDDRWLRPVAVTDRAHVDLGERPDYPLSGDSPVARAYEADEPLCFADLDDLDDDYERGDARSGVYLPVGSHGVISIVSPEVDAFERVDVEFASILAANAETALDRLGYESRLERQTGRLEEFAGIVSHDLRNPLNVAQGRLALARDDCGSDDIDLALDALERMEAIIDDTLTLARRGDVVDALEPVALADLVERCWRMVETADVRLELVDDATLRGDPDRLRHVFENLFRNAVQHGGDGATVRVGLVGSDGVYVEDDGPGVPAGMRSTIFEPGHTSTAEGTGLGLTIVDRIAEAHGWSVRLVEGRDGGARVEFTGIELEDSDGSD
jgi:PAS domain S-box-containing protein